MLKNGMDGKIIIRRKKMDSGDIASLCFLVLLLMLSAFFSSAETAFMTVNKIRMRSLAEDKVPRAAKVCQLIEDPSKLLSTILIGNNIVNIMSSSLATMLATEAFGSAAVGLVTGVLTVVVLIFGEITPKSFATYHAEKVALLYVGIIYPLVQLLTPIIFIINFLSSGLLRLLRIDPNQKPTEITEKELLTIVDVSHEAGVLEHEEHEMITNVVDFGDTRVKDVMTPRVDVSCIRLDATYDELVACFQEDKYSRLPVYKESMDEIVGTIGIKDLFFFQQQKDSSDFTIDACMREPYFTYEFKRTAELLMKMRQESVSLAIVLDEYGSMVGVVTMEDLLEEIVGDIKDEYDETEKADWVEIADNEYKATGMLRLDDFNELTGLSIESTDYDSISGYIIEQLDHMPEAGEYVETENVTLTVICVEKQRIEEVLIHIDPIKNTEENSEEKREEKFEREA